MPDINDLLMPSIEQYYPGDERWERFVNFYRKKLTDFTSISILSAKLDHHEDLSIVILGLMGDENSISYIETKMDILEGLSPIECLQSENLIKRLKVALLRYPV